MVGFRIASALVGNVVGLGAGHVGGYAAAWMRPGFADGGRILMSHAWEPGAFAPNLTGSCWIVFNACSLHVVAELAAELKLQCSTPQMHEAADLLLLTHLVWCGFGAGLLCTPMHWFGRTRTGTARIIDFGNGQDQDNVDVAFSNDTSTVAALFGWQRASSADK